MTYVPRVFSRTAAREDSEEHYPGAFFVYQPIVDIRNNSVVYYEQLARFEDAGSRPVSVGDRIMELEHTGEIIDLDHFGLSRAITVLDSRPDLSIGLNISGATLGDREACERIVQRLRASPSSGRRLFLEITETHSISNLLYAAEIMGMLEQYGVTIVVDDYGDGYSSELYLSVLTPKIVKFSALSQKGNHDAFFSKARVAKAYGALTIVEGIETPQQAEWFRTPWINYFQGHLFAEPGPLPAMNIQLVPMAETRRNRRRQMAALG